jgi:hypothetical protein
VRAINVDMKIGKIISALNFEGNLRKTYAYDPNPRGIKEKEYTMK